MKHPPIPCTSAMRIDLPINPPSIHNPVLSDDALARS
jgi:hypothetical protein